MARIQCDNPECGKHYSEIQARAAGWKCPYCGESVGDAALERLIPAEELEPFGKRRKEKGRG